MSDLVESSEFGDWLIAEIADMRTRSRSAHSGQALIERRRLDSLKAAKKVLLEFLLLQQAMLTAASEARSRQTEYADAAPN